MKMKKLGGPKAGAKGKTAGGAGSREVEKKRSAMAGVSSTGFSLKDIEFIKSAI